MTNVLFTRTLKIQHFRYIFKMKIVHNYILFIYPLKAIHYLN